MTLPMPYDTAAEPYLFCRGCGRELRMAPLFEKHHGCTGSGGFACLETRYRKPRIQTEATGVALTPLISSDRLAKRIGLARVFMKNETASPTYSWKDRLNEVHARLARTWGFGKVQTVSTGNHGISLAAHARKYNLRCHIFVHQDCPELTRQYMRYFGADLTPYKDHPFRLLAQAVRREASYPAVSTQPIEGLANPFGVEGYKGISEELSRQMRITSNTWIAVPAGIGDGVFGIWKGFLELRMQGRIEALPRLLAVQGSRCNSLVRGYRSSREEPPYVHHARGIALSIREPQSGAHALWAIRNSKGAAVGVTDREILNAMGWLRDEGLIVEPASAATAAAVCQSVKKQLIRPNHPVVCILSGSGIKWGLPAWIKHIKPKRS